MSGGGPEPIEIIAAGRALDYGGLLARQRARCAAVAAGAEPECIFLVEHAPTITLGRNTRPGHLLHSRAHYAAMGIDVIEADRGGDAAYHGPGQVVAYPIVHLQRRGLTVTGYLRLLEQAIIDTLADFGLRGERLPGYTGVWVEGAKIAAIGVGVRQWVSYHGLALNAAPDMDHFRLIVPCGIADKPVTSMAQLLPAAPAWDEVAQCVACRLEAALALTAPR